MIKKLITTKMKSHFPNPKKTFCGVALLFLALPVFANDGDEFTYDGVTYTVISESVKTCRTKSGSSTNPGHQGLVGELKLHERVRNESNSQEYTLTEIGRYSFNGCLELTGDLKIPDSVTSIGSYAFQNCTGFNGTLTLPSALTNIGIGAFRYCSGFSGDLKIPDSVTDLGSNSFWGCKGFNGTLTLSSSLSYIAAMAFNSCSGFTAVKYEGTLSDWCRIDFGNPQSNPLYYAHHLYIQDEELTELTIPDDITEIKDNTFAGGSNIMGNLIFPYRITSIGNSAFRDCSGFTGDLKIPDSVTEIGGFAFSDCSGFTGELKIPDSVTEIGEYAFFGCSGFTGDLKIPDSVTSIGSSAFSNCSGFNGTLTLPTSLTEIGVSAFSGCSGFIGELKIPDSVTSIGGSAFNRCYGLEGTVTLPSSLSEIENMVFYNCSKISSFILPESLISIGGSSFSFCSSLYDITIPSNLHNIGDAFCFDDNIKYAISLNPEAPEYGNFNYGLFSDAVYSSSPLIVPKGAVDNYKQANEWQKFQTIVYPILNLEQIAPEEASEEFKLKVDEIFTAKLKIDYSEPVSAGPESISDFRWSLVQSGDFIEVSSEDNKTFTITGKELGEAVIRLESKLFNTTTDVKIEVVPTSAEAVTLSTDRTLKCTHDHTGLKTGDTLQLMAVVSPETTTYKDVEWIVEDPSMAEVSEDGLVSLKKAGTVKVTATVKETPEVSADFEINVAEATAGDANDSGEVNVADVLTTAQSIVGNEVLSYCHGNADANKDGNVNSTDITATVNIILGITPEETHSFSTRAEFNDMLNACYDNDKKISIYLDNNRNYSTLQADILLPEGMTVENVNAGQRLTNHQIVWNVTEENILKVVIFSLENKTFNSGSGPLVEITGYMPVSLSDFSIENIYASDSKAVEYPLEFGTLSNESGFSAIESINNSSIRISGGQGCIKVYNATGEKVSVYSMDGALIKQTESFGNELVLPLSKGMYIVVAGNDTTKVQVK